MRNDQKAKEELMSELESLHARVAELEEREVYFNRREETLKNIEARYNLITDNMTDTIWLLDMNIKPIWISPSAEIKRGYSVEEMLSFPLEKHLAPGSLDNVLKIVSEELTPERLQQKDLNISRTMDLEFYRKDGSTYWNEVKIKLIRDEPGNPNGLLAVSRDITDRKKVDEHIQRLTAELQQRVAERTQELVKANRILQEEISERIRTEEALRTSEEKFRALADSSAAAVFLIQGTKYIYINPAFERITGYTMDDLTDMNFWDFLHPDFRELIRDRGLSRLKGESPPSSYEIKFITKSGHERWVDFTAVLIKLDNQPTIMGLTFDITERRHAEEKLRESERLLSDIINFLPDSTFVIDKEGKVIAWNKAIETETGIKAEEILGSGNYEYAIPFYKERRPILIDLVLQRQDNFEKKYKNIKRRGDTLIGEASMPSVRGGERYLLGTASAIYDTKGTIVGAIETISDITERKRAEEALRNSEAKFRALTESSASAILLVQGEKIIYINPSFESMTGYSLRELMEINYWEILHPDFRELVRDRAIVRQRGENVPPRYEIKIITKNKEEKWIDLTATIIDFENKPTILGSGFDITERKRAEEDLRQSEKLYRSVIENIKDTFYRADMDGNLTMMSPSGATLFGYDSVDQLIGRKVDETFYINPESRKQLISEVAAQGFVKDYEIKLKRSDGTAIDVSTSSHPYFDDKGIMLGIEGIVRDISRRKQAEESLRHSEERFSKAFHISPAPTIISTINEGRYIDVNDEFLRMLGYSREEMIGHTASELNVWADYENRKTVARKLTEKGFLQGELLHLRTKKGEIRNVIVSAEIITLNGENLILSIFYDTTDQEKLEARLRQAQKMEAIGTLAGGIAHDFNNILGAIMGYTEMALIDHKENDRLRRYLEQVFKGGERARDLVKQILAFSRQSDQNLRPLRVIPIVKEVLKLLRASLPATITIHQDIQSDMDTVFADPTQIHQVMMNLGTNAAHAMRETKGELKVSLVTMEIRTGDTLIMHHDLSPGMYIELTVSDTGHGIDPMIMEKIFDPFFTTKGPGEGTGLGLSVVYGIIKSYGGTITVESEMGKGTEFHVYLPLLMETMDEGGIETAEYIRGGNERILFVDDEEVLVQLGKEMLAGLGYDVVERTSSLEALKLFQSRPDRFDLVITDMTMPNMTGTELAKEIMSIRPGIPVMLCTGFSETVSPEKARAIGLREFIIKPLLKNQLAAVIRRVLDQKEQG
ncbi:MAG: PAS domain S-box protein [Syntrophaceae bacterium]